MAMKEQEPDDPVARLVAQIQAGVDVERNFAALHARFHPRLVYFFRCRGMDRATSEELTQEVFLRVYSNIGNFQHRSHIARWLFEIAHNTYVNEIRRAQAGKRDGYEVPLVEEHDAGDEEPRRTAPALVATAPSPLDDTLHREESAGLQAAIATLPPQMRRCVQLRLGQGLKYREIAEVLQVSIDTVKAQLGKATLRLRQQLADRPDVVFGLSDEPGDAAEK